MAICAFDDESREQQICIGIKPTNCAEYLYCLLYIIRVKMSIYDKDSESETEKQEKTGHTLIGL